MATIIKKNNKVFIKGDYKLTGEIKTGKDPIYKIFRGYSCILKLYRLDELRELYSLLDQMLREIAMDREEK